MSPRRLQLPDAVLVATAAFVLLDWVFILRAPAVGLKVRLLHMGYVAGYHLFLAAACIALIGAFSLVARRVPRWVAPLAAAVVSYPIFFFLLEEDLEAFRLPMRSLLTLAFTLAPLSLSVAALWPSQPRWLRLGCALVGVGLAVANHLVLKLNYPGFHVACITLSQLAAGVAMVGLPLPARLSAPRWVSIARDGAIALVAAWAVAVPPSNSVAVRLATDDAAPVYRFASELQSDDPTQNADLGSGNDFFSSRAKAPPVPPGAALLSRDDLVVLVVSFDALRSDVANGARGGTFKAIDELRETGIVFENAYAPATSTSGTMSAFFSGRYYNQIQWEKVEVNAKMDFMPVKSDALRFPGLLTDSGVATYLVPTHWRVSQYGRMAGGFAEEYKPKVKGYREAKEALPALLKWLKEHDEGPVFAYCHLVDAHAPYDSGGKEGEPFDRYLRELELADAELAKLIDELKKTKLWSRTILIVTADHGEAFGEHGQKYHGGWAFEQLLHVPLIMRVPGKEARTVSEVVSLIDVGPTILDLFGVATPGTFMGQSLVPILRGEEPSFTRPVAFHTTNRQYGIVFPDRIKALYAPKKKRMEVYDLNSDPGEETNLADEDWARERIAKARAFFNVHEYKAKGYEVPGR